MYSDYNVRSGTRSPNFSTYRLDSQKQSQLDEHLD